MNSMIPHVDPHPVASNPRTDAALILLVVVVLALAGIGVAKFGLVTLGLIGVVATPIMFVILMAITRG